MASQGRHVMELRDAQGEVLIGALLVHHAAELVMGSDPKPLPVPDGGLRVESIYFIVFLPHVCGSAIPTFYPPRRA